MEKKENCVNELVHCIEKINVLISKIDKFNSTIRIGNQNFARIGFELINKDIIDIKPWDEIITNIHKLIENNYDNEEEISKINEIINLNFDSVIGLIDNQINKLNEYQNKKIYCKAKQLIYISNWKILQRKIQELTYKDTLFDKITGRSNVRKEELREKELESEIIKKEYYNIENTYSGQKIRETICMLSCTNNKTEEIFEYKDLLIKLYMIDEDNIPTNSNLEWKMADLIPHGLFNQIKYYKKLTENLKCKNKELLLKLDSLKLDDNQPKIENKEDKIDIISKLMTIKESLSKIIVLN